MVTQTASMSKLAKIFIAGCMVVIAGAFAFIGIVGLGLDLAHAVLLGGGTFAVLLLLQMVQNFFAARRAREERLVLLERQVRAIFARQETLDARFSKGEASSGEAMRRNLAQVTNEIGEVSELVRQIAEQVAAHEALLSEAEATVMTASAVAVETAVDPREELAAPEIPPVLPEPRITAAPEPPAESASPQRPAAAPVSEPSPDLVRRVRHALERGAVDLSLQPVVTLPQRRITHYELTATLRDEDEVAIEADEYLPAARAGRLLSAVDALVLDRALRIARRLKARDRDIALFVGMATETIAGSAFVSDIARRLDAAADLSAHIILSFDEGMPRGFAGLEGEMLGSLAEKGFRFAVSHGERLAFDAPALHGVGVRYVRIPAARLVDPAQAASAEIHPADLPGLLRRHGITLVAESVDSETVVADLLDADVRAASGALFGGPRPVRPEVFAAPAAAPAALAPAPSVPAKSGVRSIARRA